jgi:hypothetical protein
MTLTVLIRESGMSRRAILDTRGRTEYTASEESETPGGTAKDPCAESGRAEWNNSHAPFVSADRQPSRELHQVALIPSADVDRERLLTDRSPARPCNSLTTPDNPDVQTRRFGGTLGD